MIISKAHSLQKLSHFAQVGKMGLCGRASDLFKLLYLKTNSTYVQRERRPVIICLN